MWLRPGENRLLVKYVLGEGEAQAFLRPKLEPVLGFISGAAANTPAGENPVAGGVDSRIETAWVTPTNASGPWVAFFRADERFGFKHGTELEVRLTRGTPVTETGWRFRVAAGAS